MTDVNTGAPWPYSKQVPIVSDKTWDTCVARLFEVTDTKSNSLRFDSFRVLVLGFDIMLLTEVREVLRRLNILAVAAAPNVKQLEKIRCMNLEFTHVVLNFDAFADAEHGVDALLSFRKAVNDVKIIICSSNVRGDDFGSERRCICDATLKYPLSMKTMRDAFMV